MTRHSVDFGIRGYIGSNLVGFPGKLKHRWEDFQVHEVDENGRIIHLNELLSRTDIIQEIKRHQVLDSGQGLFSEHESVVAIEDITQNLNTVEHVFTENDLKTIRSFLLTLNGALTTKENDDVSCPIPPTNAQQNGKSVEISKPPDYSSVVHFPPSCFIIGDFSNALISTQMNFANKIQRDNDTETPLDLKKIGKTLRTSIHKLVRSAMPFFASETLSLTDILKYLNCLDSSCLPQIYFPGCSDSSLKTEASLSSIISESCNQIKAAFPHSEKDEEDLTDFFSKVVRIYPKPQCLKFLSKRRDNNNHKVQKEDFDYTDNTTEKRLQTTDDMSELKATLHSRPSLSEEKATLEAVDTTDNIVPNHKQLNVPTANQKKGLEERKCTCHNRNVNKRNKKRVLCESCKEKKKQSTLSMSYKERWPKERPLYLQFHLWKCNRDTAEVIQTLASCIGCQGKLFTFAGTKDRRGITVQRITGYKITIDQLKRAMLHGKWDNHVRISNLSYQPNRIELGALYGNHFKICIRGIDKKFLSEITPACNSLEENGFVNFYGCQRFGTRSIRTYMIGGSILKKKYKVAVRQILGENEQEQQTEDEQQQQRRSNLQLKKSKKQVDNEGEQADDGENDTSFDTSLNFCREHAVRQNSNNQPTSSTDSLNSIGLNTTGTNEDEQPFFKKRKITPKEDFGEEVMKNTLEALSVTNEASTRIDSNNETGNLHINTILEDDLLTNGAVIEGETTSTNTNCLDSDSSNTGHWCFPFFKYGDAEQALQNIPRHLYLERQLLQSLVEAPGQYLRALQRLPKNTLTLYVHSLQSLIWNHVTAYRIETYGAAPIIGDFVIPARQLIQDKNGEKQENDTEKDFITEGDNVSRYEIIQTSEQLSRHEIFDVVLPIPGDSVEYPEYLLPKYKEICLAELGFEMEEIRSLQKYGLGQYAGGYRHIVVRPTQFKYRIIPDLPNGTIKLLPSDVDRLLKQVTDDPLADSDFCPQPTNIAFPKQNANVDKPSVHVPKESSDYEEDTTATSEADEFSNTAALLLSCTLPKSSYLTMACRELSRDFESDVL